MNETLTVRFDGELTIYRAQEIRQRLLQALQDMREASASGLEIDLDGVTEADTAGMQVVLAACRQAWSEGRCATLARCSAAAGEVIGLLGLAPHFAEPAADRGGHEEGA